ncbi:hypothetical protein C8J35_12722 [Rhizobium sp. PP-F2F-G38]|uniref:Uncharacterized protein n=1 Tax=Ferranicluibacter rubi TaxID=2715133 RepID=A0AA44CCZ4_9HYPH|nr:hypothetical protein [Ferranicluibacter rubi]PYE31647.1 hypothetical protein C8J37_11029 [Rhizobium sp. PP-WC-1G-195]PYE92279.1 hypothetical protein C8J35_12722 [Rhizobium sp. PP-F2F-G38]TCP79111.1 hypothetical protein C8J31_11836 [Rhizobium sp. PP-CC-2G-626]TCQ04264.1 hypothetical protein C8J34_10962 [Rhizobium sp. PP-F2F-G36]TCQ25751.1 hypothetical protein C8J33_10223 [Rhizobium sp. PP-CC-3G-465]
MVQVFVRTPLVVEDEILIRMDAADYFADEGFDVLEAGTADDALLNDHILKKLMIDVFKAP